MVIGAIDRIAILSHWPEALIDVSWVSTFLIGPDRPILAVGAVAVKDGKVLLIKRGDPSPSEELEDARWVEIADLSHYRMTRGTADLIRRLLARQEDGLQCHGG
jgi:hypothetical protein